MKETRVYKQTGTCSIQADIYYQGPRTPVIIYIHSGALIFGTREWLPVEQIEYFTSCGFSLVNIDYRLAPETKFEWIIEDIRDAIHWVRTDATQWYDFDIKRIAVIGGSAGGYLSLLTGTMDYKPNVIVSFYGYGDILGDWYAQPSEFYCAKPLVDRANAINRIGNVEITSGTWDRFDYYVYCRQQGKWVQEVTKMDPILDEEKLKQYNPIDNITEEYPPTLFLHGNQDTDVPYKQSTIMYEKLKSMGIQTELITIEGADHVFDHHFTEPQVQLAFKQLVNFLKVHLYT
ncbi:alpha/beta hydrolase [Paenibacillus sp. PR3]|uniref:Alpha/beta hydrolase n=1 Tax=Paenibacillus terricola TaxID=2763503 RepID=A0ABR8MTL7_9BACL|nr:alpha/beta hydrolase [Paenibacillus terricola]MBD3918426.1 alpha/beta hydrolase [Paenibacillus terricola]